MILMLIMAVSVSPIVEARGSATDVSELRGAPSAAIANSNAPVEQEFAALLRADEAAEAEVQKWLEGGAKKDHGDEPARAQLKARVKERFEPVRQAYQNFLSRHPRHVPALLAYGSFLQARDEEGAAQRQWEKVLEIDPANADAHHNLACRHAEMGQIKKASDYFTKAIGLDSSQAAYYYNFANALYVFRVQAATECQMSEQQIYARVLQLYSDSMRLDPTNLAYATDRAQTYYAMRPFPTDDAFKAWTDTLKRARTPLEREEVWTHLARVKMLAGHLEEARSQLNLVTNQTLSTIKANLLRAIASREAEEAGKKGGTTGQPGTVPANVGK